MAQIAEKDLKRLTRIEQRKWRLVWLYVLGAWIVPLVVGLIVYFTGSEVCAKQATRRDKREEKRREKIKAIMFTGHECDCFVICMRALRNHSATIFHRDISGAF
jgi:hypothetical protein